jgi:oxygen-independent coproporphyrinogen III oxidase
MLVIPDDARPLVRTVAALFDAYLHQGGRRHAAAV